MNYAIKIKMREREREREQINQATHSWQHDLKTNSSSDRQHNRKEHKPQLEEDINITQEEEVII